jgi:hypothetical protein
MNKINKIARNKEIKKERKKRNLIKMSRKSNKKKHTSLLEIRQSLLLVVQLDGEDKVPLRLRPHVANGVQEQLAVEKGLEGQAAILSSQILSLVWTSTDSYK